MTDQTYPTKTGRTLTDDEIEQLADDLARREFDIEDLKLASEDGHYSPRRPPRSVRHTGQVQNGGVVTRDEAEAIASQWLPSEYVITGAEEFEPGWVFFYNSRRFFETGAITDALAGNAPLLVDRLDGSVHPTGTARPTEEYVFEYAERLRWARERWPDALTDRWRAMLDIVGAGAGRGRPGATATVWRAPAGVTETPRGR